tara:strand:+ start:91 stop:1056 length:966 start_codon:yes stop_codon:yes gene_type:complete
VTIFKKIICISISAFFIFLCLKDIPLKNLFDKINYNLNLLLIAIFLLYLVNILKALRLKVLLNNYQKKKFQIYFKPVLLRQFLNTAFFFNIGEIFTPVVLKKYFKCSYFEGISIIFAERLIDLTIITIIFGISFLFNDFNLGNKIIYSYFLVFLFLILIFLLLINYKKKIFLIPSKILDNFVLGYKHSVKNINILYISVMLTFLIWFTFILIDMLIFRAFNITNEISTIPNIIFLTGVMVLSQFIPAAPASIGVFNYLVIQSIEAFYVAKGINYDLEIQTELTSISMIVLLIYIIPDITWGSYVAYKESLQSLEKIKLKKL